MVRSVDGTWAAEPFVMLMLTHAVDLREFYNARCYVHDQLCLKGEMEIPLETPGLHSSGPEWNM